MNFPTLVYALCFLTSALCAGLLFRAYGRTRARLVIWSAISFCFLALNNFMVLCDLVWFPNVDFLPYRHAAAFGAVAVLLYAFIWESES
jgi:hypothetical protein